jgi:hypothetical protein
MRLLIFIVLLSGFNGHSQKSSSRVDVDTNFFFVSNNYACVCAYDSALKLNVYVQPSLVEWNGHTYVKFDLEESKHGKKESIYMRKDDHSYLILTHLMNSPVEYPLVTFREKLDEFNAFSSYSIFGLGSTRREPKSLKTDLPIAYYYHFEGADSESEVISSIYFDEFYHVLGFAYYDGGNNVECHPIHREDEKR